MCPLGVAGLAYGVNLMIGKVFTSTGTGTYDDFMMCIIDAYNAGANIINLSLGVSSILPFVRSDFKRDLFTGHD